jgi:hypothetical protein
MGYSSKRMKRYFKQPSTWGGLLSILAGALAASGVVTPELAGGVVSVIGAIAVARDEDGQAVNRLNQPDTSEG